MKNHRNIDVWLERACHLMVVGLSVAAAFLLRFDFTIPSIVSPILKQAVLIAVVAKLPIFDWVGLYRSLRRFVSIPDLYLVFVANVAGSVLFAAVVDVLDRADNAAVGAGDRCGPMLCRHGSGAVFGPNLRRSVPETFRAGAHGDSHLRSRRRGRRTGS